MSADEETSPKAKKIIAAVQLRGYPFQRITDFFSHIFPSLNIHPKKALITLADEFALLI